MRANSEPHLVYAIIVHYLGIKDTIECINSLIHQTYKNLKIIIVDNASPDQGLKIIQQIYPNIEQIINNTNLGAAGGYNTGLKRALETEAKYIYLVNNDTISDPEVIHLLVQAIERYEIDIISPLIYYYNNPQRIWSAGGNVCPLTLDMIDNHGRGKSFIDITRRDFLTTCAMMFRREVLENIGLFDDRFFCYYDDADYSLRATRAGYRLAIEPKAKVWHKVSVSSGGADSPFERYWMGRGSMLYLKKHAKLWQWLLIIPWRLLSLTKMIITLVLHRKFTSAISYLKGIYYGILFQSK